MASWLSADGVVSLLSEAESDERDLQESSTDVFAFIGSPTVTFREVKALENAVHSSDDSTCKGMNLQMLKVSHKHWACLSCA